MNCAITGYGCATLLANLARQFARHYLRCNQTFSNHKIVLYLAPKVQSAVRARTRAIAFAVRTRDGEKCS